MTQEIPDEIMRVAHGLYADAQQRHNVTDIARALIASDTAARKECAEIAREHAKAHCSGMGSETEAMRLGARSIAAAIEATMGGRDG